MSTALYYHPGLDNLFILSSNQSYAVAKLYGTKDNLPFKPLLGRLTASYVRDTGPIKNWELAYYRRDTRLNHLAYAKLLHHKYHA